MKLIFFVNPTGEKYIHKLVHFAWYFLKIIKQAKMQERLTVLPTR